MLVQERADRFGGGNFDMPENQRRFTYPGTDNKPYIVGNRDGQNVIEVDNLQAKLLNEYNGPLTIYIDDKVVNDPAAKARHLAKILKRIPASSIESIKHYSNNVITKSQ